MPAVLRSPRTSAPARLLLAAASVIVAAAALVASAHSPATPTAAVSPLTSRVAPGPADPGTPPLLIRAGAGVAQDAAPERRGQALGPVVPLVRSIYVDVAAGLCLGAASVGPLRRAFIRRRSARRPGPRRARWVTASLGRRAPPTSFSC